MGEAPRLQVVFFRTSLGREPVREWLKALPREDQKIIGSDILTVQREWPIGRPLVGKLTRDVWEVCSSLDNRIARVLFIVEGSIMVLLHGFIKKTRKTPKEDLDLAKNRLKQIQGEL